MAAANGKSGATKPMQSQVWIATITSSAAEVEGHSGERLELSVVDEATGETSAPTLVGGKWEKFSAGGSRYGWARKGSVTVPAGFKAPGAVVMKKGGNTEQDRDYIKSVALATHDGETDFPISSWLAPEHGQRAFFGGTYLPKDTPDSLQGLRADELKKMRGGDGPQPLTATDRAYGYQLYDDLGGEGRPALGGTAQLPYPRHVSNSLAKGVVGPGKPWLPQDEQFDESKARGFNGGLLEGVAPAVNRIAHQVLFGGFLFGGNNFKSFKEVLQFFHEKPHEGGKYTDGGRCLDDNDEDVDWDMQVHSAFNDAAADSDIDPNAKATKHGSSLQDLFKFRAPRVLAGRGYEVLLTDEEYGRQFLAGMNPCMLKALTKTPAQQCGSAIGAQHVDEEIKKLGGSSLAELVAQAAAGGKPRLFMVDYMLMDLFWPESKGAKNREEHAGRVLLFLKQSESGDEEALLPLAFELKHRKTAEMEAAEGRTLAEGQGVVYSRQELVDSAHPERQALWTLAKAVFRSVDSGYHQLVSHWLRCHACTEPFAIALHRRLSTMHPVFRLMLPHFRYTLDINSKARSSLINAGGVIEGAFTPGAYAMRLSSAVYGSWRFHQQALPEDLAARGMLDAQGALHLADYPYAQDGLELWTELETYFAEYLSLYYKADDDVAGDEELQAWWSEVKDQGHPDLKKVEPDEAKVWGFAGPISTVAQLVRVLATVAFTASAHHAAVNFGQYDFASLVLNVSSMVRRPIPRPSCATTSSGAADAKAYKKLTTEKGEDWEEELLSYLADPFTMVKVMVTVKLLSIHAEAEQTLDERNTMITDPVAAAVNLRFTKRMQAMEARFQSRNADPASWTRYTGEDGERKEGMRYSLLLPPSEEGLTFKGVPYSVSI